MKLYQFWPIRNNEDVEHIKDVLNGDIHLTDWRELNDILEGVYTISEDADQSLIPKNYDFKKNFMVACFSKQTMEDNESSMLRNHLMWVHYASKHTGVAIELDINDSLKVDYGAERLKDVTYDGLNEVQSKSIRELQDDDSTEDNKLTVQLLTQKLPQWKYEQEMRLLVDVKHVDKRFVKCRNGHKFFHDTDRITICHMYLGSRFLRGNVSPCILANLLALCSEKMISVSNVADEHRDIFMTFSDYERLDELERKMGKRELPSCQNCTCSLADAVRNLPKRSAAHEDRDNWVEIMRKNISNCEAFKKKP